MSLKKSILFIILILLIDQVSKIYIKTHFVLGEDVTVFSWFKIYFIENDGMAWGTKISDFVSFISDRTAKISLTLLGLSLFLELVTGYMMPPKSNSRKFSFGQ